MADGAAGGIELESLVTRLIGDASSFLEMMGQSGGAIDKVVNQVKQQTSQIEGFQKQMEGFASGITSALGAIGLGSGLKSMISSFQDAESAQFRLTAAMQSNGETIGSNLDVYKEFASQMSATTKATGTEVTTMLARAEAMGVSGDAAMRAVKNALALSAATGEGSEAFIRQTAALEEGNTMMLGRYIPTLQGIENESDRAAEAQNQLSRMFRIAESATATSSGSFMQLQKALGGLRKDFGAVIVEALTPVIGYLTEVVNWFRELDPSIKRIIAGAIAMTAAISGWGPAVGIIKGVLGPTMKLAMTVFSLINPFSLIGIGILAAVAAITIFIQKSGGISEAFAYVKDIGVAAWEWIKSAAMSFWEWFQPIGQAMASLGAAIWDKISKGAVWLWDQTKIIFNNIKDFISGVWDYVTGGATVNWQTVKDVIMNALLFAEYTLNHFGDVASLVWVSIQYGFVSFVNQVQHFFQNEIPAYADWFANNWKEIFTDIFNFTKAVFQNLGTNIVNIVSHIPDLISGKTNFGDLWKPLTEGFQRQSKELILPERVMGPMERELKERMEREGTAVAEGFIEFRDKKLAEFGAPDVLPGAEKAAAEAAKFGNTIQKNMKDSKKELDKFDAALYASADAFKRIDEYLDRIARKKPGPPKPTPEPMLPQPELHAVVAEIKDARAIMGDLIPFAAPPAAPPGRLWGIQAEGPPKIPMGDLIPFTVADAAGAAMGGGIARAIREGGLANPAQPIPVMVAAAGGAPPVDKEGERQADLLQEIRDLLAAQGNNVMDVDFANLA